jgi:ribosomal protein L11 methyltransferase
VSAIIEQFDLVVANIIAPILEDLVPRFPRLLKPGGILVLSGLLSHQVRTLREICHGLGLKSTPEVTLGEWAAFTCRRED